MKVVINIGIKILIGGLSIVYAFLKPFPVRNKITFISRQGNDVPMDFRLLIDELSVSYPNIETVVLSKFIKPGLIGAVRYAPHIFRQMYHIATARLVVLDTYCIAISVLKHKKSLKTIQIWHAIGLLKKAGYPIIGREGGRSLKLADAMHMHKNYDYICASSESCRAGIGQVFGYPKENVIIKPLPRVDLLCDTDYINERKKAVYARYPELSAKKNILYAPTHRKDETLFRIQLDVLSELIDYEQYNLIVKPHFLSEVKANNPCVMMEDEFTSLDMAMIADVVIIDYSSILFELALLKKPIYFFTFDLDEYLEHVGFFIDFVHEIPGEKMKEARKVMEAIEQASFDSVKMQAFLDKYVTLHEKSCTRDLAECMIVTGSLEVSL